MIDRMLIAVDATAGAPLVHGERGTI